MMSDAEAMPVERVEATRAAVAFARAWAAGDGEGTFVTFMVLPEEQRLEFVAALAFFTTLSLELGGLDPDEFWTAVNALIEKEARSS